MDYSGSREICPREMMENAEFFPWDTAVNALALTAILALAVLLLALGFLPPVQPVNANSGDFTGGGQIPCEITGSPGLSSPELEILP